MRKPAGYTLIEILAVVTILGILGAIVVPQVSDLGGLSRPRVMASTVRHVRQQITYHAAISSGGYPLDPDPMWFRDGRMPKHLWTDRPIIVESVDGYWDEVYPPEMDFDLADPDAANGWYNATNGEFCVLVPHQGTDEATEDLFYLVNGTNIQGQWLFDPDDDEGDDDDDHDDDDHDDDDHDDDDHDDHDDD